LLKIETEKLVAQKVDFEHKLQEETEKSSAEIASYKSKLDDSVAE